MSTNNNPSPSCNSLLYTLKPCRSDSIGSNSWESLQKNASKAFQQSEAEKDEDEMGADEERSMAASTKSAPLQKGWKYWRGRQRQFTDRLAYQYFNWRFVAPPPPSLPPPSSTLPHLPAGAASPPLHCNRGWSNEGCPPPPWEVTIATRHCLIEFSMYTSGARHSISLAIVIL